MNQLGDIKIFNYKTFTKLQGIFNGKKPTNKTILLLRLYIERDISSNELMILKQQDYPTNKLGSSFEKNVVSDRNNVLYERIEALDKHSDRRMTIIEKMKKRNQGVK